MLHDLEMGVVLSQVCLPGSSAPEIDLNVKRPTEVVCNACLH